MLKPYRNFKIAGYVYAYYLNKADDQEIQRGIDYYKQYMHLDKVYLENHRATTDITVDRMRQVKALFEKNGIATSGGITSTGLVGERKPSIYDTYCFTDPAHRTEYLRIVRELAEVFDEIILDDFFFTSCRCEMCIAAKGKKSWAQYRLDLMEDFSKEIVALAKQVNPGINFIIKYPNWYESYQETGYNPGKQKDIFDMIYTGTETREASYSHQHLQRYESYSIMRLMDNIAPGRNGGGWIDQGGSMDNLTRWIEQGNLTMFAKARELMLFNFSVLVDTPALPALGANFYRIDALMDKAGAPVGIATYEPYDGDGEDQVLNYIGMCGVPFEPKPEFDFDAPVLFLSETSACDPDVMTKLEKYVREGGNAIVTTGFMRKTYDKGIKELTSVRLTNRHVLGDEYLVNHYNTPTGTLAAKGPGKVLFEILDIKTNASWADVKVIAGENNFPVLSEDMYGKGYLYVFNVPENFSDLFLLPKDVWQMINKEFGKGMDVYVAADTKCNLFAYDNDVYGLYGYGAARTSMNVIVKGDCIGIRDLETGVVYPAAGITARPSRQGDSATLVEEPVEHIVPVPMMGGKLLFFTPVRS